LFSDMWHSRNKFVAIFYRNLSIFLSISPFLVLFFSLKACLCVCEMLRRIKTLSDTCNGENPQRMAFKFLWDKLQARPPFDSFNHEKMGRVHWDRLFVFKCKFKATPKFKRVIKVIKWYSSMYNFDSWTKIIL
jgi:hypothetical protein